MNRWKKIERKKKLLIKLNFENYKSSLNFYEINSYADNFDMKEAVRKRRLQKMKSTTTSKSVFTMFTKSKSVFVVLYPPL